MKTTSTRITAIVLCIMMTFVMIPTGTAFAANANGAYVLTSITHSDAIASVSVTGKTSATITVPYGYASASLDLSAGCDWGYDTATYAYATPSFPGGSDVTLGSSATVTIQYGYTGDATTYTTDYTITVEEDAYDAPTYSGTITKTRSGDGTITISASDFAGKYDENDGEALDSVVIAGSNPTFGTLRVNSSDYTLGNSIDLDTDTLTFVATDTGTVSYTVTAYESGNATSVGSGILTITVSQPSASTITFTGNEETEIEFSATSFNTVCQAVTGDTLNYVTFTLPSSSYGTMYVGYTSASSYTSLVAAGTSYYYASTTPLLSTVSIVPYTNYYGTFSITYKGYSAGGESYTGTISVTVADVAETTTAISYSTDENEEVDFVKSDFYTACSNAIGGTLSYVKFSLPSTSYGKLYFDYTSASDYEDKVASSDKYYYSSTPSISKVTFVPAEDKTGTCTISYTGYNTAGTSYSGTVKVVIGSDDSDVDAIKYETDEDETVTFKEADFNEVCDDEYSEDLKYVKFTLPSSSYGKLYFDYTSSSKYDSKVSASTKYYYDDDPSLSDVTFVPASGYEGTVTITYTGVNDDSDSFTGKVKITVGDGSSSGDIEYETDENEEVDFDEDDFNEFCNDETDDDLDYVKFTLPSSSKGVLYFGYTSSSSYTSKVSASTKYYLDDSPALSKVTFVPADDYEGTVSISFKGYNEDGDDFSGTVTIEVGDDTSSSNSIAYTTTESKSVSFDEEDFNDVCEDETDEELSYVKFTLPSSSYGTLYYNGSTKVSASTKYFYEDSPYLSKISLTPDDGYSGSTFAIVFTGYNVDGDSFSGKVLITVKETTTTTPTTTTPTTTTTVSAYFSDVTTSYSWAATYIDALYKAGYITGTGTKTYDPDANIKRGDFILMLYKALGLKSSSATTNFSDVPKSSYYYTAIAVAKALGIAQGDDGEFDPEGTLTRQDAMVLVNRALSASGTVLTAGTSSDLSSFKDTSSISSYAYNSVATLVKAGIINGTASKINPKSTVSRAEMAVIVYRVIN